MNDPQAGSRKRAAVPSSSDDSEPPPPKTRKDGTAKAGGGQVSQEEREQEQLIRRRERNAKHSKKARQQVQTQIESLRSDCERLSAENLHLYHNNKDLHALIQKAKEVVQEQARNPQPDFANVLIETMVSARPDQAQQDNADRGGQHQAEFIALLQELKQINQRLSALQSAKANLSSTSPVPEHQTSLPVGGSVQQSGDSSSNNNNNNQDVTQLLQALLQQQTTPSPCTPIQAVLAGALLAGQSQAVATPTTGTFQEASAAAAPTATQPALHPSQLQPILQALAAAGVAQATHQA